MSVGDKKEHKTVEAAKKELKIDWD